MSTERPDPSVFMQEAIRLAREGMDSNLGGPFGAVVVRDGIIVGRGRNAVTSQKDPTAHAEVVAIREACRELQTHELTGCTVYSSCEPCPMCLAALMWARVDALYYAASRKDAAEAGFDDEYFYIETAKEPGARDLPSRQLMREDACCVFDAWKAKPDKTPY